MKKKRLKIHYPVAVAIAAVLLSLLLAYGTNFSDPVSVLFKNLYPQVIIGSGQISVAYWDQAHIIAQRLDTNASAQKVSDQLVKVKEESLLLDSLKVSYSSPNQNDELNFYKTGKEQQYKNLLEKDFNSNENLFTQFVVKPEVYDALLRMKYNSDFTANADAYAKAASILTQIKNGQSFDQLAKTESDDKVTGQLGGDLGFVSRGQLLPELEKAVMNASLGQVDPNIVVSRLGYHIIYPVESADINGVKNWHVKHIFVETKGFDNWLNPKLKGFWVWHIK
ncbi:MAG: peptidylprolyl isomerase [Candidatus Doudnabacteria bacterium]